MISVSAPASARRIRVRVTGVVQGVGFRPYVYRLAGQLGLSGWVLNDSRGVLLEVEGGSRAVAEFLRRLGPEAPPLAIVDSVHSSERPVVPGEAAGPFEIRASDGGGVPDAPVSADSAACPDCLRELCDPQDRRYRYPFINCTNCGPRFTIVRGVPYDRPLTSMSEFPMCEACEAEYDDPGDRRFHAQPNACPVCGPSVVLVAHGSAHRPGVAGRPGSGGPVARPGRVVQARGQPDPIRAAAVALCDGDIVAIKGIGGYHLACRADDEPVVARLRSRKHREDKPFALMVASEAAASALVRLGAAERGLLHSPARPIVLAPRSAQAPVAASVAPRARELGVMLPYSPLHHLLAHDLAGLGVTALVLTSGNVSDEPIAYTDPDAFARLGPIADRFLLHDRPIVTRTDDSVVRVVGCGPGERPRPLMIRRSRGYVPAALPLPGGTRRDVLGCGAELKHTFCLAKGSRAWVSHHIGDLRNYETLQSFTEGVSHFERLFAVEPSVVAHDLHPEYLSTKYGLEREGVQFVGVQHHHAHLAACLAEHGETGPAVAAIFDGTGYGTDGTIWGGEFLLGDLASFTRVGSLLPVRLPGGERAIRQPWRMACAWLSQLSEAAPALPPTLAAAVTPQAWSSVGGLAQTGLNSPLTTSMGRLFDAVAALCGVRPTVSYEGQAAIEFEAACTGETAADPYPMPLVTGRDGFALDPRPLIAAVMGDLGADVTVGVIARRFHAAVAAATVCACARASEAAGVDTVVLSGGVFQNRRLLETCLAGLRSRGLRVLVPELLPAGDGGIAFGQVAVAAARLREAA
ncbi:MAG: hydrogenase maturation protein HypF [Solirubrobacteraceae bacterium]|nr:hydrogenase maturation protein HypF [Solirubrobacteraceae bacterium]